MMNISDLCYDYAGINVVNCDNYRESRAGANNTSSIAGYIILSIFGIFLPVVLCIYIQWNINQSNAKKLNLINEEYIYDLEFQKKESMISSREKKDIE